MHRAIVVCSLLTLSLFETAKGQDKTDTSSFIQGLVRRQTDTLTFFYTDKVDTFFLNKIKQAVSNDQICGSQFIRYGKFKKRCIKLTVQERNNILDELEKYRQPYWKPNLFSESKLVALETLQRIKDKLDTLPLDGAMFEKAVIAVNQFINPIYFHGDNLFVMLTVKWWFRYKSYQVAAIDFDLTIYRKQKKAWERWLVIDGGVWDF